MVANEYGQHEFGRPIVERIEHILVDICVKLGSESVIEF